MNAERKITVLNALSRRNLIYGLFILGGRSRESFRVATRVSRVVLPFQGEKFMEEYIPRLEKAFFKQLDNA